MPVYYRFNNFRIVCFTSCIVFFFTCFPFLVKAQLCTGNLGDPIVHIDFGDSYNPGLPAGSSDYKFVNGCTNNGEYTIDHYIFGCAENTWFPFIGDHGRTTLNGNYMLVNGAGLPGTVIANTVNNLCGNTTYEFAAWVSNAMKYTTCSNNPTLTNLTFTAETLTGTIIGTYNTGNIPIASDKEWKQYGFFFKTAPDVNAVVLRIKSDAVTACGSVFLLDDITLRACGPSVTATLDGVDTSNVDVCTGYTNPFILNATYSASFTDPLVQWQSSIDTGNTWQDIPGATTTTYAIPHRDIGIIIYRMVIADRVNFNSPQCRIASHTIRTEVHPLPLHQPTTDLTGCLGKDLMLASSTNYILKYNWQGPNGFTSNSPTPILPDVQYADTGIYSVLLTADFGCQVKDSFYLHAFPSTTITAATEYNVCGGSTVQLAATGNGSYTWTPATGLSDDHIPNPVATPTTPYTQYKVVLTNNYGCKDSAFVNVHVNENVEINAGNDKQILLGDTATIDATVSGTEVEYYWSPPLFINDINAMSPKVFPPAYSEYTLHASSMVGCGSKTATVKIKVLNEFNIPNAFTPNGDGKNDLFHITALDNYTVDKFLIYNRWGKLVFQTTDAYKGWDGAVNGDPQPIGAYVYYLYMRSAGGKKILRRGSIMLIR